MALPKLKQLPQNRGDVMILAMGKVCDEPEPEAEEEDEEVP